MSGRPLKFRHEVIDANPPGSEHDITLIFDVNGDDRNDIVIGGKAGPVNLFWYENPTWQRHDIAFSPGLEAGGVAIDINGNGRLDIVAGQQYNGNELYWFECPEDPAQPWPRHLIEDRFTKYHDQAIGDVDGDGEDEIVIISQLSGVLGYYDIPKDPYAEPWPRESFHLLAEGVAQHTEGLVVVDIDGDGENEIIAGTNILRRGQGGKWAMEPFAVEEEFLCPRVAVCDLDGDGRLEMVIVEAERPGARLAICRQPDWKPEVMRSDLFHAHSLAIADFTGSGRGDIFVAEMGLGKNENPRMFVYLNKGGDFEEMLISEGIPTHEAKVGDLTGNGRPDIVGKAYDPQRHIDVWFNES